MGSSSPPKMSGRWSGYYVQEGGRYPITADFLETDGRLAGFMYDGQPDRAYSLEEIAALPGPQSGPGREELEATLRGMAPGEGQDQPIQFVSHLPTNSILQGERTGRRVRFLKRYQGVSYGGYQVGEQFFGYQDADHEVIYEGELSADGLVLEGRWRIEAKPGKGVEGTEDGFRLQRAGAPAGGGRPWWRFW